MYLIESLAIDTVRFREAEGGNSPLKCSILPPLPTGLTFDPETRMLARTPKAAQESTAFRYLAIDLDGDSAMVDFAVSVAPWVRLQFIHALPKTWLEVFAGVTRIASAMQYQKAIAFVVVAASKDILTVANSSSGETLVSAPHLAYTASIWYGAVVRFGL